MSNVPLRRLKILHVTQTAQGGVGGYLEEIVGLQVQRHGADSVRVVLPEEHAALFPGLAVSWLQPFHTGKAGRLRSSWRMAVHAMRAVRSWQPDIVHLHSTFAGFVMRPLLALIPGAPKIVYCAHGWAFADSKFGPIQSFLLGVIERLLSHLCTEIVCVSQHDAKRAEAVGISKERLKVVLNGIADLTPLPRDSGEADWPKECLRVLFVGRLDHAKGADVLFSAMEKLGESAFAIVVGSAVVFDVKSVVVPPVNVKLIGWINRRDINQLYASADLLAVPSRNDACPIAPIEAMRAGLPVVASRVGGLPEIVQEGVTGRLVEAEDALQLATAMKSLDGTLRTAMGAHARQRFLQLFRLDRTFEELELVYLSAVGNSQTDRFGTLGGEKRI